MPYLRFTKDRRGYENTFLVEPIRTHGREQLRVLYWFRTPPHIKVGRAALDEEAIAALEAQHPEVEFDWDRILQAQPPPAPEPEDAQGRQRFRERRRDARPNHAAGDRGSGASKGDAVPSDDRRSPREDRRAASPRTDRRSAQEPQPANVEPAGPEDADLAPSAGAELDDVPAPGRATAPSAAEQALGIEALERLRARYAEVLLRIRSAKLDPAVTQSVAAQAERLNPDAWVTPADVTTGLAEFEIALAEITRIVGPPRRRTRRGGRRNRRRGEQVAGSPGQPHDAVQDRSDGADESADEPPETDESA